MNKARLTEAEKKAIVREYREGKPVKEIALRYNVDAAYPSRLAQRRGEKMRMSAEIRGKMRKKRVAKPYKEPKTSEERIAILVRLMI